MQRREDLYGPDALEFRPERWDDPQLDKIGWGYLPFNGGPRVCLGSKFAIHCWQDLRADSRHAEDFGNMLASYTVIRILQQFPAIHVAPGQVVEGYGQERQHLTLTLSNVGGCKVVLQ